MRERPTTEARLRSRCGVCDATIHEGETIVLVDGEWCHEECADDA